MFRKITQNDREFYINSVKDFYSIGVALHPIPEGYITKTFDELMASDVYTECFIIEKDIERAGYALLAKTFSQEAGGMVIWLEELYILPEFRSCGLGRKFLAFLKENMVAARLRLELCPSNSHGYEIYRRNGFEILDYNQMIYDKKEH